MSGFYDKLNEVVQLKKSWLCVGLDPVLEKLPEGIEKSPQGVLRFLREIINATARWTPVYKPNFAYFEALGPEGMSVLKQIIEEIPAGALVIGDAKRGDVGHSSAMYAKTLFETFGCDAATVSPYQGYDSVEPFLSYRDKGTFVLCITSNSGADDFQRPADLYLKVAQKVCEWNQFGNCGLVVGATRPELVEKVRSVSGPMPFLIPGVGTQGGSLENTLQNVADGTPIPALINASRAILYSSSGRDFAEQAAIAAEELWNQINQCRL
ncbi:MAG: orotidine-5'-phosphate decarboxylase [SAR324 cluster bacterium]|nr:orotidine-5'-phosphate decarboxylase [SAR324 cluster bacterium]